MPFKLFFCLSLLSLQTRPMNSMLVSLQLDAPLIKGQAILPSAIRLFNSVLL